MRRRSKHIRKRTFAERIIVVCLLICLIITGAVLWEYHRLDTVIPSSVLGALLGLWGGELLIIALRQIFGADVISKSKQTYSDDDEGGSI